MDKPDYSEFMREVHAEATAAVAEFNAWRALPRSKQRKADLNRIMARKAAADAACLRRWDEFCVLEMLAEQK